MPEACQAPPWTGEQKHSMYLHVVHVASHKMQLGGKIRVCYT